MQLNVLNDLAEAMKALDGQAMQHVARVARYDRSVMGLPCWPPFKKKQNKQTNWKGAWALCTGITSRGSPTLVTFATITPLKPRLWYFCLWGTSWKAESSRWRGCGEVCYGHVISYVRIYHWLSKECACLLLSVAVISEMSLSGSSTSALASSGWSRTIDTSVSPSFSMSSLLSAFLGLVLDGEGLVFVMHLSHSSAAPSDNALVCSTDIFRAWCKGTYCSGRRTRVF